MEIKNKGELTSRRDNKMKKQLKELLMSLTASHVISHYENSCPENTILVYGNAKPSLSGKLEENGHVIVKGTQDLVIKLKNQFDEFFKTKWYKIENFLTKKPSFPNNPTEVVKSLKKLYELGYLPLMIKSLKEGVKCPYNIPYMTMYNTSPDFIWLKSFIEGEIDQTLEVTYIVIEEENKIKPEEIGEFPKGLLKVVKNDSEYEVVDQVTWQEEAKGELRVIFKEGELFNQITPKEIKEKIKTS